MRTRLTMGWRGRVLLMGALLAPIVSSSAAAQTSTAMIRGTVRDGSGNPVAAAMITATDTASGYRRSAVAGSNGSYALLGLRPGVYQISVSSLGQAPAARTLQVFVGQSLVADFEMTPQAVAKSRFK